MSVSAANEERGGSVPTAGGNRKHRSRAIHPGVTREGRNGLTESVMIIYDKVKNPGNTRGCERRDNSHLFQLRGLGFFLGKSASKEKKERKIRLWRKGATDTDLKEHGA